MAMIFSPPTSAPASKGPIPKPPKKVLEVVHKATPVLLLQRAQLDTPWVEFGSIPLGSVHELKLKMFNPGKSSVTVKLHKVSNFMLQTPLCEIYLVSYYNSHNIFF